MRGALRITGKIGALVLVAAVSVFLFIEAITVRTFGYQFVVDVNDVVRPVILYLPVVYALRVFWGRNALVVGLYIVLALSGFSVLSQMLNWLDLFQVASACSVGIQLLWMVVFGVMLAKCGKGHLSLKQGIVRMIMVELLAFVCGVISSSALRVGLRDVGSVQPQEIAGGELLRLDTIWGMRLGRKIDPSSVLAGNVPGVVWVKKNIYRYAVKRDMDHVRQQLNDFVFSITPRSHKVYNVLASSEPMSRKEAEQLREQLRCIYLRDAPPHSFSERENGDVIVHSNVSPCEVYVSIVPNDGQWMVTVLGVDRNLAKAYQEEKAEQL